MVPRAEYISSIWTRLFLSLSSIRHHVLREREIDKSSNIKLLEFPKLSEDIVEIAKSLRNDTKIHGLDGPIVEYIIQNDVLDTLVSLAQEDIPDGLLILMVGLYSALLSTLPPAFFLNDRVAAPLRALLRSIEGSFKHEDSFERIVYLLDILGEQTQKLPDLIKVIIPDDMSMRTLYNIFKYIIDTNVNLFGLKEAILKGLSSGLIGGPEGEEVILSIVFGLIRVFSMGPSGQFIELFQFIQQCLDASRSDDAVPSLLMTAYRDYFVDRVFTTTFSGRSTKDNSLGILLDILLNLGEEPKCSELYLPLLSRTIRLLERNESGTEASNIELYGQALWSRMQWRCFPLKRPEKWTESISIHRQRLASCLSLLPSLGLEIFDSAVLVSNFYRIHLLSIERVLGEDLSVISHDKNSFPVIRHERTVFDATKTANLAALFSKIKRELSKLWTIAAKPNLMMSKFLVGCILFFDSVHFYGELNEDDPSSLLSVIKSLVSHCPEVIPDEDILERMIEFHTKHDFWDLRRWDPIMFVNDAVVQRTANAYILGNMIMRLSACIQVRSTKESTILLHSTFYPVHPTFYPVHSTFYPVHSTLYPVHSTPMNNVVMVGLVSALLSAGTLYNAYSKHLQFYPVCTYLMKSSISMTVLVSFALYCMFLVAYGVKTALFGPLRLIEVEHLQEYGWLTISESFLAMTIFRDEFDTRFVVLFTTVLFIKAFHWLARDRVDYMEQTARVSPLFHWRMLVSVLIMATVDCLGLSLCIRDVLKNGPSMSILFANEFALLMISLMSIAVRYALNTGDLNRGSIWEHRSIFLFYYDFVVDLLKLLVYSVFFGVVVMYYGVPLHIIRDLYLTIRSFVIKIKDIYRYRRATANMNERYPVASAEELAATDRVCIICREEMESARKLPCGHLFHFRCLRSWLERQQACPTCRRPILEEQPTPQAPVEGEGQAMVWRNGRWEPLIAGNGAQQGPIVQNPDLRGQPDIVVDNAGPALVFPNLQPPPPQLPPAMAGNVIPGPFGTVPVILIPPEQIAVFRPPRAPQTPDPQPTNTLEDDQNVPQRPQSAMPTGLRRTIEPAPPKPIYFLKSGPGGQGSVFLEPLEANFPVASPSVASIDLAPREIPLPKSETTHLCSSVRRRIRSEVATLAQLQFEISSLTERLVLAESRLESLEAEMESSDDASEASPSPSKDK